MSTLVLWYQTTSIRVRIRSVYVHSWHFWITFIFTHSLFSFAFFSFFLTHANKQDKHSRGGRSKKCLVSLETLSVGINSNPTITKKCFWSAAWKESCRKTWGSCAHRGHSDRFADHSLPIWAAVAVCRLEFRWVQTSNLVQMK